MSLRRRWGQQVRSAPLFPRRRRNPRSRLNRWDPPGVSSLPAVRCWNPGTLRKNMKKSLPGSSGTLISVVKPRHRQLTHRSPAGIGTEAEKAPLLEKTELLDTCDTTYYGQNCSIFCARGPNHTGVVGETAVFGDSSWVAKFLTCWGNLFGKHQRCIFKIFPDSANGQHLNFWGFHS